MTLWSPGWVDAVTIGLTLAGLVAGLITAAATRRPLRGVPVLLDFLLAAGLLRLTAAETWTAIATAAAIVAVRRLVGVGLRGGAPAGPGRPARPAGRSVRPAQLHT